MFWLDVLFELLVFLLQGLLQIPLDLISRGVSGP